MKHVEELNIQIYIKEILIQLYTYYGFKYVVWYVPYHFYSLEASLGGTGRKRTKASMSTLTNVFRIFVFLILISNGKDFRNWVLCFHCRLSRTYL